MKDLLDSISIVLCGEAGQGIQTIEAILTRVLKLSGLNVFATKEYMSRVRGGSNSTTIRISSKRVNAYKDSIDMLIPLDSYALAHLEKRISADTIIFAEKEKIKSSYNIIDVSFTQIASGIGSAIYSNVVAVGLISGALGIDLDSFTGYIKKYFSSKGEEVADKNVQAAEAGYEIGIRWQKSSGIKISIEKNQSVKGETLLNGAEAIAMGAIAGGCNFISAYPMTPSTGIFTFLSQHAKDFNLISEQAEDEISAINMALGASYAGGRALAATSGGGFALMVEGLSLAGMLEVPVVVILAQRPGPATGLPTRTEQADLNFALYSAHGEFPRIILSPGTIEDAFYLTRGAFNTADKFQSPVIILTDQYFVDSYYNNPAFDLSDLKIENHIIKTDSSYKRYKITEDGISPRGIPGFGDGLVCLDSDEHDQEGHITEDLNLRKEMVDKRLRKLELIKKEIIPPRLYGGKNYKHLIICWGSNYHVAKEAMDLLRRDDTAVLYFNQVYPLHGDAETYIKKAFNTIIIENNATCQFGNLIKLYTGIDIKNKILKYNGLAFSVEEIKEKLSLMIG